MTGGAPSHRVTTRPLGLPPHAVGGLRVPDPSGVPRERQARSGTLRDRSALSIRSRGGARGEG